MSAKFPLAVLISGNGSNLQAIIEHIQSGFLPAEIKLVISDRADAYGLVRAHNNGIMTQVIERIAYPSRRDFELALQAVLENAAVKLIVLSGFMRVLSADFVSNFAEQIINIHPSLLPKYRGLDTYQQVLTAGDKQHGSTVHYVTAELDSGPIIAQQRVPVLPDDTVERLKQRTQQAEHHLYSRAIKLVIENLTEGASS